MPDTCDAIVIGGGPSGATVAILLARAGWSVAVVEKADFPRRKVCGEYVSATSLPLFRELGIEQRFLEMAGPPVREVGIFSGDTVLVTKMPQAPDHVEGCGRALGREHLDKILLDTAVDAGATVWQPFSIAHLEQTSDGCLCQITDRRSHREMELRSRIVIAAHGSWESGSLPTQPPRVPARCADLFGFKAHFRGTRLADGLMPLLAFPGGYGGMVHTDAGRTSLSCCIRRDRLERCREALPGNQAAETVLAHITRSCRGVRDALASADLDGAWLSAGPIRPGFRRCHDGRFFFAGNAAGEAHPVIAEGISMAAQSASLLCRRLTAAGIRDHSNERLDEIGHDYAVAWRRSFALRLRASAVFAHWAMSPRCVALTLPVLRSFPALLALCARLAGKAKMPLRD